jgi:hypothetical protein
LLALVGARQVRDVVGWVVVADVLQRGGDGFDQVVQRMVVVMGFLTKGLTGRETMRVSARF